MVQQTLPKSDLKRLHDEVGAGLPEAALPSHLSDYWLALIARDLEAIADLGNAKKEHSISHTAAPLAIIVQIFSGKLGANEFEISMEDLRNYFEDLWIEINMEIISRKTDLKIEPATLETIFTDRDCVFTHNK